jgi:uncharacterized protein GlcG (DUF336 family)
LPTHQQLKTALKIATNQANGPLSHDMWGTIVNRDGFVCAVAFTGDDRDDQWPGSRVISAQKANTANAFSLPPGEGGALFPGLALSTANIYWAVQPGGSLFGLQESNPVDPDVAYGGNPVNYGQPNDPMVGKRIGGVNVFGGGVALYNRSGLLGAIGVSGDTSCADHIVAWKTRDGLRLDFVPTGVTPSVAGGDNIIHDITPPSFNQGRPADTPSVSASGFGHPQCDPLSTTVALALPVTHPLRG